MTSVLEPTKGSRRRNASASLSVVLGVLAVATLPAAIYVAETRPDVQLLDAGFAIPPAVLLALGAIVLGRRGARRAEVTLTGGGGGTARVGRALGLLGLLLALTATLSVIWYAVLTLRGRS